jgi:hypothetical protein
MKAHKLALALAIGVGGGLWASLPGQALAAGNVDSASGEATVASPGGQPRALAKGDRVQEGDTIATGANGAVLITTDDSGVLAVRPRSRLTIEAYKVNGNAQDSVVLSLLRGSLRSITGWISKTAPKNYKITTATATVGIRGTDHEVALGEGAQAKADAATEDDSGTWNQVTEGATTLATSAGALDQQAGTPSAIGRVKSANAAPLQAIAPATLFKPQLQDARTTELKKDAQTNQQQRLDTRKQQVSAAGGSTAQGNTAVSTQCAPNAPAQKALDDLIRAYEQGDIAFLQQRLSPSMVGYSTLINDVQTSTNAQRQTRIQIKDRQMQCGPDVSSITFSWEKTFLDAVSFQPGIVRGTGAVLLTGLATGQWQVGGVAGNTPFSSAGGAGSSDGTVTVSTGAVTFGNIPQVCTAQGYGLIAQLQVVTTNSPAATVTPPASICTLTPVNFISYSCSWFITGLPGPSVTVPAASGTATANCGSTYTGTPTGGPYAVTIPYQPVVTAVAVVNAQPGFTYALDTPLGFTSNVSQPITGGTAIVNSSAPQAPNACAITFTVPTSVPPLPPLCSVVNTTLPAAIEVRDADVTSPSLQVLVSASNGDIENLVLPRVSPGVYRLDALPVIRGGTAVLPSNGRIDLPSSSVPATVVNLTIKYFDARASTGTNVLRQATLLLTPNN